MLQFLCFCLAYPSLITTFVIAVFIIVIMVITIINVVVVVVIVIIVVVVVVIHLFYYYYVVAALYLCIKILMYIYINETEKSLDWPHQTIIDIIIWLW